MLLLAAQGFQGVREDVEHGPQELGAAARRAGQVDDQCPPERAGLAARKEGPGCLGVAAQPHQFVQAGVEAFEYVARSLGGHVAGRKPRAPGREDQVRAR